ncbi:MAG: IclR family transcriptional regulator [Chloroflexi bacterium]|nr:IclR family transcriptional regulator [Chloroflexota bacterium]
MTARDRPPEEAAEDTSFARGLRLLLTVADRGEVRADELGTLLETPLSSVYRYLRTLVEFGFVERRGGQYRLGPRLMIGSGTQVSSERLIRLADPVLRAIVDETGETALVMRRIGLSAVCLHQVESSQALRVALDPGAMTPLYAGAMSRVLLAFAPVEILGEVLGGGLVPVSRDTPDEAVLRDGLAEIVAAGGATSEGELIPGSVTVAVPIFQEGEIVGSLAVIGPATRCGLAWRTRSRRLLETAAASLIATLATDQPR